MLELDLAAVNGATNFTLDPTRLADWAALAPATLTSQLVATALPGRRDSELERQIGTFLAQSPATKPAPSARRSRPSSNRLTTNSAEP